MGYPAWLKVDPTSGSGNKSVTVETESAHTGRVARSGIITFKAANCKDVEKQVNQPGATEFVKFDSTTIAVDKDGTTLTVTGTTNSSKLTFSLGSGYLEISLPDKYTAYTKETVNGEEIEGDPGADSEIPFSITIEIPANETTSELSKQLIVTDAAGNTAMTTITETEGDPYLMVVDPEGDINLDTEGTAVSVQVSSNTSWTVE